MGLSFADQLDGILHQEACLAAVTVPRVAHLTSDDSPLDHTYYVRHRIETVRRIRETARIDAQALAHMLAEDYESARSWAAYTVQELNHDRLYLADLAQHGLEESVVLNTVPLASTSALLATLRARMDGYGSLPAVAYSLFVEWNSARASAAAVTRATDAFGRDKVRGSAAHVRIDADDQHGDLMCTIAEQLVRRQTGFAALEFLLREVAAGFRAYFTELDAFATAWPNLYDPYERRPVAAG